MTWRARFCISYKLCNLFRLFLCCHNRQDLSQGGHIHGLGQADCQLWKNTLDSLVVCQGTCQLQLSRNFLPLVKQSAVAAVVAFIVCGQFRSSTCESTGTPSAWRANNTTLPGTCLPVLYDSSFGLFIISIQYYFDALYCIHFIFMFVCFRSRTT